MLTFVAREAETAHVKLKLRREIREKRSERCNVTVKVIRLFAVLPSVGHLR